jgi:hypothetical protein
MMSMPRHLSWANHLVSMKAQLALVNTGVGVSLYGRHLLAALTCVRSLRINYSGLFLESSAPSGFLI